MWQLRILAAASLMAAGLALAACGERGGEGKDCPAAAKARTPSGFCVPRYVSLKRGQVFARKGPGKDYPALWVYHVQGLPVQVVEETTDWRRICDPDGGAVWVHRSMLDGRRMVMALGSKPIAVLHNPRADASPAGAMNARALASLDRCQGGWCKIRVAGLTGWAPAAQLWGTAPAPQCR